MSISSSSFTVSSHSSSSSVKVSSHSSSSTDDMTPQRKEKIKAASSKRPYMRRRLAATHVRRSPSVFLPRMKKVSSEASIGDDDGSGGHSGSSHEDTLGVDPGPGQPSDDHDELNPPPRAKKQSLQRSSTTTQPAVGSLDLDTVIDVLPEANTPLPAGAAAYDPLRASLPGAVSYAGSFMVARAAQFALTVSGNTREAAMAYATLAGVLHIGMEPIVGALRARMGMRSDKDTKNFTNFVTAVAVHVHSSICCDQKGMEKANELARESLAPYFEGWDKRNDPMPAIWDQARTMLKAGAQGFGSNELPFFVFAVVYMVTNPAGLWVRSSLLEGHANQNTAAVMDMFMGMMGGAIAGIGTAGVQNAARTFFQHTGDAPLRGDIKLARLNKGVLKFTRHQLELLKQALKDSRRSPDVEPVTPGEIRAIEDGLSDILRVTGAPDRPERMRLLLEQLPSEERDRLFHEVRVKLNKTVLTQQGFGRNDTAKGAKPYALVDAIVTNYLEMVATKDDEGIYRVDLGKVRRTATRTAVNVAALMAYAVALVDAINTVARYAPAHAGSQANTTDPEAFNATATEAYGKLAALGWSLITCWVGGRALVPVAELTMAVVTGVAHGSGSAVGSMGRAAANLAKGVWTFFAPAPITNGPPQKDAPPPRAGVDTV